MYQDTPENTEEVVAMQDDLGGKTWVNRKVVIKPSDITLISADETPIPLYAVADL